MKDKEVSQFLRAAEQRIELPRRSSGTMTCGWMPRTFGGYVAECALKMHCFCPGWLCPPGWEYKAEHFRGASAA